jgi:hypothetical protein
VPPLLKPFLPLRRSFDNLRLPLCGLLLSVLLPLASGLSSWNLLRVLRLLSRSLESRPSPDVYEPPDDSDALLRFFSESVSFWTGGGDFDKLWDLATFRRESLRGGDFDILIDLRFPSSFVDIVETDAEEADRIRFDAPLSSGSSLALSRFRPLSSSAFASCSSAMPFLIGLSV